MYDVIVHYTEPLYRLYRNLPPKVYSCCYQVEAPGPTEALGQALALFKLTAQQSSVGWSRKVVGMEVTQPRAQKRQAS